MKRIQSIIDNGFFSLLKTFATYESSYQFSILDNFKQQQQKKKENQ